eukprot:5884534-Prymnesium_polylepis.1
MASAAVTATHNDQEGPAGTEPVSRSEKCLRRQRTCRRGTAVVGGPHTQRGPAASHECRHRSGPQPGGRARSAAHR